MARAPAAADEQVALEAGLRPASCSPCPAAELPDGTILKTPGSNSYGPLPRNGTPPGPANPRGAPADPVPPYQRIRTARRPEPSAVRQRDR